MEWDNAIGFVLGVSFALTGGYFSLNSTGAERILSLTLVASGLYVCYHFWAWDEYMVNV